MHTRHAGFTLLELVIVIAIFAVFSLMAYGGLDSVLKTRREVEVAMQRTAELQKAYMRLRNDFQQLRNRPVRDGYGDTQPVLRTERTSGALQITRGGWRNPLHQPRASLERVAWRIDGSKLKRESFRVLDQAQDSKPVELDVLDGVEELRWRFLDKNREWQDDWPPLSQTTPAVGGASGPDDLPLAVELKLVTKDWGELVYLFRPGIEATTIAPQAGGTQTPPQGQPPTTPPAENEEERS